MSSAPASRVMLLACGSFNPITNMHLRMFELGRDFLNSSGKYLVVGGIISPVNDAYEKKDLAVAAHRCAMVQLAIKNTSWIKLDTWESEQDKWTETVKVLRHHYNVINSKQDTSRISTGAKTRSLDHHNANVTDSRTQSKTDKGHLELKLLCGADLLQSFAVPGLWQEEDISEIVSQFGIVVVSRYGSSPEKFIYESDILSKHRNNIFLVTEWIPNEICSTSIRRALRRGQSVKYLMQDSVINYIHHHHLYGVTDFHQSPGFLTLGQTAAVSEDVMDVSKKNVPGLRSLFTQSKEESGGGVGGYRPAVIRGHSAPRILATEHLSRLSSTQSELCSSRSHSTELRPVSVMVQKDASVRGRGEQWRNNREEGFAASRSYLRTTTNPTDQWHEPCATKGGLRKEDSDPHRRRPHFSYHFDDRGRKHGRDSDLKSIDGNTNKRECSKGIEMESQREVSVGEARKNELLPKGEYEMRRETDTRCRDFVCEPERDVESRRNSDPRRWSSAHVTNITGTMQHGSAALATRRGFVTKVSSFGVQGKDTGPRSHAAEVMQCVVREELIRLRPETCV